ncbi:MAG: hypothetical protein ABGW97_16050 [Christiangramia sp.]|uniref:hypothetical protein n=1 Tax=Christiangramia sp. TaxID=1931228 RepID=UPI003241D27E
MNAYQFIVKMKDYASSELKSIARSAGVADDRVDELNRSSGRLGNTFGKLKTLAAGAFTVVALTTFTNRVIDARAEYEKFQAVLTTASGDRGIANSQLKMLTDFASTTPFQLNELTGSFVKLVNRGFIPTKNQLTSLGDLAASQGKGFDQLSEALLDAETGEFERLKEFGIKASKAGDQVSFSFKGVTKTVNNNSDAIRNALMQYGNMEGVAGSMNAISKTLGGRISNLKDQWNNFLVAVGGESGGIFAAAIDVLSAGLSVLTTYLPHVSNWFRTLWTVVEPLAMSLWNAFSAFSDLTGGLSTLGTVMNGVLVLLDWFVTGLMNPFAMGIAAIATGVAVYVYWAKIAKWATVTWQAVQVAFNASMWANPITWVVAGILALIGVIGMVVKYTDGWGESWKAVVSGSKFLWEGFVNTAKANFLTFVNAIMIGINKIKEGWFKFKNLLGIGDGAKNNEILAQIQADTEARKKLIIDANKEALKSYVKAGKEFSNINIQFDKEGIKNDFKSLKDKFSNFGVSSSNAPDNVLGNNDGDPTADPAGGNPNAGAQTIVSGGTRRTEINITIQKLQDDTKIFVSSAEEGISSMGEKTQEILLRAINSINQMQTN